MKKRQGKRHTPEQIIRKLREADTMLAAEKTIGQVVQVLEVSEQTFHRWRKQYGEKVGSLEAGDLLRRFAPQAEGTQAATLALEALGNALNKFEDPPRRSRTVSAR